MKLVLRALVFALAATWISTVAAEPVRWTTYTIPETGTSVLDLHRPSGPARRLRTGISNRRRSGQAHHTGSSQQLGRFTCCFSGKETPASEPSIQEGDVSVFCCLELQGRQGLVRSLQLLKRPYPLRADQLSCEGRARLGRRRHPYQPVANR